MQYSINAPLQVKAPDDFVPLSPDLIGDAFPRLFARKAKDQPEKIAVTSEGGALTYLELDLQSNGLARRIVSALGPGKEPVAILAGHDSRAIVALLGTFKSGRPYVGLDSSFPPERMKQILSDSQARLVLADESQEETARQLLSDGIVMLGLGDPEREEQGPDVTVAPTDLALVYYTSGSTGRPKGVAWSHQQLVSNCIHQVSQLKASPSDRCMLVSSIGFASSRSNVYDTLLTGGAICMYDIKNKGTASSADWALAERVTIYRSSSPVFRSIFSALPDGFVFPDLRLLLLGAQTATAPDVELYRKHTLPHCVFGNHFALTEAGVLANFLLDHQTPILWDTIPVAAEIMGDKEILLLDENGDVVKPGEKGEIVVRGQYLSSGYLNQPELTAKKFRTDPQDSRFTICYTGDMGRWNEAGLLEHLGRKDNLVKIRGYNVDLQEVERVLCQIASVKEAAVVARSFPNLPEVKQLVAYVVPAPGPSPTPREWRDRLVEALPTYMVPPVYVTLEKMPLTPNGKLDRMRLPEVAVRQSLSEADLPADDIERRLIAVWQKCFNLEMVGVEDNFFELGGDSLLASLMFAGMEREFGKTFPLNLLLEHGTIRKLAAVVRNPDELAVSALYPLKPGGAQLPLFIFPGGEGDVLTLKELADALEEDQPVYGIQAAGFFGKTVYARRVEEAARYLLQEIRKLQSAGPYYLAGHSFGGVIAFEAALQLTSAGEEVGMIGLLDSIPPGTESDGNLLLRMRTHLENIREGGWGGFWEYLAGRLKIRVSKSLGRYEFYQRLIRDPRVKPFLWEDPFRRTRFASANYKPARRYPGTLTIFKVTERPKHVTHDRLLGWRNYAGGAIEEYIVPGDHAGMIKPPHVEELAKAMNLALKKARQISKSTNEQMSKSTNGQVSKSAKTRQPA